MDRLLPTLITVGVIILAFVGMYFGWRALSRRSSNIAAPESVPVDSGLVALVDNGLYVASTLAGLPLERVAAHGLGFRSRCTATVSDKGIAIALTGRAPFFISRENIQSVKRATWAIDKAVEPGGLVAMTWILGNVTLDSYFRIDGDSQGFLDAAQHVMEGLE